MTFKLNHDKVFFNNSNTSCGAFDKLHFRFENYVVARESLDNQHILAHRLFPDLVDFDMYTSVVVYDHFGLETEEYLRYGHSSKEEFKTQYNKFETARLAKLEQEAAEKAALEQEEKDAEEAGLSLEAFRAEKKAELFEQLTCAFERHSEEFDTDELRAYIDNVTEKKAEAANVAAAAEE